MVKQVQVGQAKLHRPQPMQRAPYSCQISLEKLSTDSFLGRVTFSLFSAAKAGTTSHSAPSRPSARASHFTSSQAVPPSSFKYAS